MKTPGNPRKFPAVTRMGGVVGLLARWKGSIYKLIGLDIFIWLLFFYIFNCLYRFLLDANQRRPSEYLKRILNSYGSGNANVPSVFQKVVVYCRDFNKNIPLTFVLGFYVTTVLNRWWGLWGTLPWPDDVIHYLTTYLRGQVPEIMSARCNP
ncbi:unnamed protein product [Darwinula stevensoni]|uniref:Bestrophin homolog n=1 Tax=Darwinula stevensoni TaxID=69355 RepID=A0A7R8X5H0_9CRUS|nr:unnamed protein product [Darwinula stevensoni]CAG0887085.1 unnamed protein product [Darwinula stevensoni]